MNWSALSSAFGRSRAKPNSEADYGLHTLVPKSREATECIDIVAVHGLNGHYLRTWTDEETGVNWLRDIIPMFLKGARVMSFWYNSTVYFSKSTSDIQVFAHQLLEGLVSQRRTYEETARPIIFICHSLGGLVFKQAFVKALASSGYHLLGNKIHGVVFFGTPHRGSELASWGSTLGRVLRAASFNTSTNVRLTRDLERRSRALSCISDSFLDGCSKLQVVSCYETSKLDLLNCLEDLMLMKLQVVEQDSATLGIPSEIIIPLDGDHRSICRFSDINARQFSSVKARLNDMVQLSNPSNLEKDEDTFLLSLKTKSSDYNTHKNRNPPPVEGTCTWLLVHPVYMSWFNSPGPSLLWISADPGCGKSVLASFLIDQLSESSKALGINVCYFFFKSDNWEQSDVKKGLRALLHQLHSQQKDLLSSGMVLLQGEYLDDVDRLWQALVLSTDRKDAKKTICIIDGLDECTTDFRDHLINAITASFSMVVDGDPTAPQRSSAPQASTTPNAGVNPTVSTESKLKFWITSRPENKIKIAFQRHSQRRTRTGEALSTDCSMIRLRGEDETDAISGDITKVVKAKVDDLIRQGLPVGLLEDIQAQLIARADRTFLWVSLILNLLEQKMEAGASRRELDELLENRDIYRIYGELLAFRGESPRARKMLQIVLAAMQPMSIEELSIALAVEPEDDVFRVPKTITFDHVEYDIVYPFENHIKSLCGHFIRVVRNRVYLVHETAREFLLKEDSVRGTSSSYGSGTISSGVTSPDLGPSRLTDMADRHPFQHSFSLLEARALLLRICATYLYCLGRRSKCTHRGTASDRTEKFLRYAARNWVSHFHQTDRDGGDPNLAYHQNLCHPRFPGFVTWTSAYWYPDVSVISAGEGDDGHDACLRFFNLLDEDLGSDQYNSSSDDDGDDDTEDFEGVSGMPDAVKTKEACGLLIQRTRTAVGVPNGNPTSLSSHYFPKMVDGSGFVSLDFSATPGRGLHEEGSRKRVHKSRSRKRVHIHKSRSRTRVGYPW